MLVGMVGWTTNILPPDELIRNYRVERARLDAEIDAKLTQICDILGIED